MGVLGQALRGKGGKRGIRECPLRGKTGGDWVTSVGMGIGTLIGTQ